MPLHRRLRRRLAGWLVLAILFTQIATAAYACPMDQGRAAEQPDSMAEMSCAEMMARGIALDPDQPGLCLQHCQFGKTQIPADAVQALYALAAEPVPLFVLRPADAPLIETAGWNRHERSRNRAPPLVHSILHCCYRI